MTVELPDKTKFTQNDHKPVQLGKSFPRAVLGLPINFQFADGPVDGSIAIGIEDSQRDPPKVELVSRIVDEKGARTKGQRMASPVITRPIFIHDAWQPGIIILRTDVLDTLEAQVMQNRKPVAQGQIKNEQIRGSSLEKLSVMHGKSDALSAFEVYLGTAKPPFVRLAAEG